MRMREHEVADQVQEMDIVPTPSHPHPSPLPEGEGIYGEVARSTKPTSTSGDCVLLRYIETPQVKSFTLPSLESLQCG